MVGEEGPEKSSGGGRPASDAGLVQKISIADWVSLRGRMPSEEEKQHWVLDEAATKCSNCDSDSSVISQRHHCRNCGDVFCDRCTKGRTPLTAEEGAQAVRVCDRCLAEVTQRLSNAKDDDVWGSDSEPGRSSPSELHHEWQARQNQFHILGYRDGIEAGKNSSAQEGFDAGYAEATAKGFNWGVARGLCSAFAALAASVRENLITDKEARVRLENLAASMQDFSSTDAQRSFYRDLNKDGTSGADKEFTASGREESGFVGITRLPESHSAGVWEGENSSLGPSSSSSSGASELEELEKKVRSEFEVAAIQIQPKLL